MRPRWSRPPRAWPRSCGRPGSPSSSSATGRPPGRTSSPCAPGPGAGGQAAARRLRRANILSCGIGLPEEPVEGDVNGLRLGTPEVVRLGMGPEDMPTLADLVARGLDLEGDPATVAPEVTAWRRQFTGVHHTAEGTVTAAR